MVRDVTAESAAKILTDVDALAVMKVASEPVRAPRRTLMSQREIKR
jgi:hypothetical protein